MSDLRDLLVSIASQVIGQADSQTLSEIKGLCFWRERELRAARASGYSPGDRVEYLLRDGKTRREGTVSHVNKFSLSIWLGEEKAARTLAVPIERVIGLAPRGPAPVGLTLETKDLTNALLAL